MLLLQTIICVSCSHLSKHDWPHEVSDVAPDPRIVYGKLGNGFRYVFMPNVQLPKHFSVRLYVKAGSLMEEEHERGLAHFLEHMSFMGICGYPEDQMIQTLQHLGVPFGSHNNAYTSSNKTVYKLDFMDNSPEHLKHGLKIMAGIADGMLLEEASIKKEIGIILAEKRDECDYDVEDRLGYDYQAFVYRGLRISERRPIGIGSVIKSANTELLRNFYKKWYRPERMILVIVGDLDSNQVETDIKDYFSTFSGLSEAPSEPNLGVLNYKQGLRFRVYQDKELSETSIELISLKPYQQGIVDKKIRKKWIYESMACSILNERMGTLSTEKESSFIEGECSRRFLYDMFTEWSVAMKCNPERVHEALKAAENQLRKIFEYGFTDEEFDRVKHENLCEFEKASNFSATKKTDDLIESLLDTTIDQDIFTSYQWDYNFLKEFFEKEANKEECLDVFKNFWDTDNLLIYLSTNSDIQYTDEQLKEAYYASKAVVLEAPEEEDEDGSQESELVKYHFGGLGEKGAIADQCYNAELDCYQYKLSNNIRVNLKQTNYDKGEIFYRINFGNGMKESGTRLPGITNVTNRILYDGGIGQFSQKELFKILPGHGVEIPWIDLGENIFTISSSIKPVDFEVQMNLICGYLMEPAYRSDGLKKMHKEFTDWYNNLNKTTYGICELQVNDYLTDGHPDYKLNALNDVLARTPQEVKNWLKNALTESYMEVSIVGDFDQDKVLEALLKTLGALPMRKENKQQEKESKALLRAGPETKVFGCHSTLQQADSMVYWELSGCDNEKAEIIAEIFDERLRQKVRVELGECYSRSSELCFDGQVLQVTATTDPEKANYLCELIVEIAQTIANKGVTQDELNRVIVTKLLKIKNQTFTNWFWLDCLEQSQECPDKVKTANSLNKYYKELKLEEVNEAAKQYLQLEKALKVIVVPESYRSKVEVLIKVNVN